MITRFTFIVFLLFYYTNTSLAQFNHVDSLRGSVTPERAWWDLIHYDLQLDIDIDSQFIKGFNTITFKVLDEGHKTMQIDLQRPLSISSIVQNGQSLGWSNVGPSHFVTLASVPDTGSVGTITVYYEGKPRKAIRAPWDGGFSWKTDELGNPFVATSCQGIGASIWWPCKDHMYDEADSMTITVTVPEGLRNISNGRLISETIDNGRNTSVWKVVNPINNYGVNINIGDYIHFSETFDGINGPLDMDYFVLRQDEQKARNQFKQCIPMMSAFEHWFGPYPFYEDGFKLVQVPYLGMEHQSSVTYGNGFNNGYLGTDLSGTGWGMKFDYIIIHETGHEWFANNITYKDIADMWIHESFTTYSEALYLEYFFGKEAAAEYIIGMRKKIQNDKPIIGEYGVNNRGSGDMYFKGSNILHTIRQIIDNDNIWLAILRGLNRDFYHQTVTTHQIEEFISKKSGKDLSSIFNQYLRDERVPLLEYKNMDEGLVYRWYNVVDNFNMPVEVIINGTSHRLHPTTKWKFMMTDEIVNEVEIDKDYYAAFFTIK